MKQFYLEKLIVFQWIHILSMVMNLFKKATEIKIRIQFLDVLTSHYVSVPKSVPSTSSASDFSQAPNAPNV